MTGRVRRALRKRIEQAGRHRAIRGEKLIRLRLGIPLRHPELVLAGLEDMARDPLASLLADLVSGPGAVDPEAVAAEYLEPGP